MWKAVNAVISKHINWKETKYVADWCDTYICLREFDNWYWMWKIKCWFCQIAKYVEKIEVFYYIFNVTSR